MLDYRKSLKVGTIIVLLVSLLAACSGHNGKNASQMSSQALSSDTSGSSKLPPVVISYYYPGTVQKDNQLVEDAINKILKSRINATIKLEQIDWGSYEYSG